MSSAILSSRTWCISHLLCCVKGDRWQSKKNLYAIRILKAIRFAGKAADRRAPHSRLHRDDCRSPSARKYLHERGYTMSGPLLPGHNTSPQDLNRQKWHHWTSAVEQAYQELQSKCDRVFVCGESMGGLLTLHCASHHPEIAGIVIYSPRSSSLIITRR